MLKFLMENKFSITMKEAHDDTIKEHIMRYGGSSADTTMLDAYMKYEDKMIIQKIFEPSREIDGLNKMLARAKAYFRWNSPRFIKLFLKMGWEEVAKSYHNHLFAALFTLIYILSWVYYTATPFAFFLSGILHMSMVVLIAGLITFKKSDVGSIEKEHISKDL
jgi:hypothetical protein